MSSGNPFEVKAQRGISDWIAQNLGGTVARIERQTRWRPAWFVEAVVDGDLLKLYIRGDRALETGMETTATTLRYEYEIMRVLEANDIPVPKLYGWCDDPRAIVMAWAEGEPYVGGADRDPRLHKLIESYVDVLARIHSIDIEQFVKAGVPRPEDMEAAMWGCITPAQAAYDAADVGPQPLLSFARGWLKRNIPVQRNRMAFVTADAPQFLFSGDRITAIHDLEAGYIGDPAFDLASMRPRDTVEPSGPLWPFYKRYMDLSGDEIDRSVLGWHTVAACYRSLISLLPTFANAFPHTAYTEYLGMVVANRHGLLLAMAEGLGMHLQEPPDLPQQPSRATPALSNLIELLKRLPDDETDDRYRFLQAESLAHYAQRMDQRGRAIEEADMEDIARVLGHTPDSRESADAELEALVKAAGPDRDRQLIEMFYRLASRDVWLIKDLPGVTPHRPLQPLGR